MPVRFSDNVEAYLNHRNSEPDELSGYTDKNWYREGAQLKQQLDQWFSHPVLNNGG